LCNLNLCLKPEYPYLNKFPEQHRLLQCLQEKYVWLREFRWIARGLLCIGKTLSIRKVERAFEQYISDIEDFSPPDNQHTSQPNHSTDIAAIAAEIRQIEKKTAEVMSMFMLNSIDFATYQGMVKIGNERRVELEARQALLQNAQKAAVVYTPSDIVENFRENWNVLDNEQRQQFIQKFIKKIIIHRAAPSGDEKLGRIVIDEVVFNEF